VHDCLPGKASGVALRRLRNLRISRFWRKIPANFATIRPVKAIYVIPAAISLIFPVLAHAELKWEQTSIELNPKLSDKQAIGHFKYENTGKTPVHFKSVKASCGCTTAQTQKEQVGPGEKGEITATFNIGDRTGQQIKTVAVETDDPAHPNTTLTLKTNIASVIELIPNFVFWQTGEDPTPKTIIAKPGNGADIKNLDVTSTNQLFDAKVEKGPGPGQFRIHVAPKDTKTPAFATITVKTDYPKEAPKTVYVTARVTGPVSAMASPAAPSGTAPAKPSPTKN
jgi:hypothetical protein